MALWGNTFALFLSDMLIDSINEMKFISNRTDLLNQLKSEEDADYQTFFESASAKDSTDYDLIPKERELLDGANASIFFTKPSMCHTARLPSESRCLGILTESKQTGVYDYEKGINMAEAQEIVSSNDTVMPMPLVMDESERESCEVELIRDYKDYFFASNRMGWTTIAIPNEAERRAYVKGSQEFLGVLVMCLVACDWDICPEGEQRKEAILNGQLRFEVNDNPVTNVTDLLKECMILRGEQGHLWEPNDAGQNVLRARVLGANRTDFSYLSISSLVLL